MSTFSGFTPVTVDTRRYTVATTLVLAASAVLLVGSTLLARGSGRIRSGLALLIGLGAAGIGVYDTLKAQLGSAEGAGVTGSASQIEIGLGLWLVDVAALVLVLGAVLMLRSRRRLQAANSDQPSGRWAPLTHPATSWAVPAQPYRTARPKLADYSVPEDVRTMPDTDRMGG